MRGAVCDLLPRSVLDRVKVPYPSTKNANYAAKLQEAVRDHLSGPNHPLFDIVGHDWLATAVELTTPQITAGARRGLERALDPGLWVDIYQPPLKLH